MINLFAYPRNGIKGIWRIQINGIKVSFYLILVESDWYRLNFVVCRIINMDWYVKESLILIQVSGDTGIEKIKYSYYAC